MTTDILVRRDKFGVYFTLGIVASLLVTLAADAIVQSWGLLYDDAYISYRYADNLARGAGLVWNVGEAPTEGFTNLLLVLVLAPFLHFGVDPLLASRVLALISLSGIGVVLFTIARRQYSTSTATAIVAGTLPALIPASLALVLVGMETVPYTLGLLTTLVIGARFIAGNRSRDGALFGVLAFVTSLLRPEAALVIIVVGAAWLFLTTTRRLDPKPGLITVGVLALTFLPYFVWKQAYFGNLLPNPFYIKSNQVGLNALGVESVRLFIATNMALIALAAFATVVRIRQASPARQSTERTPPDAQTVQRILALATVIVYLGYFLGTETLMDIEGRFTYPMSALLVLLTIPTLSVVVDAATRLDRRWWMATLLSLVSFLLVAANIPYATVVRAVDVSRYTAATQSVSDQLGANPQLRIAHVLADFPQIEQTLIAYGDAGVIPYFSRAQWLDPVGLNDSFIAHNRDHEALVNYFFERRPDLVVLPGDHDGGWITYGHGPLGNYSAWASDPRWDEFEYVGSIMRSDTPYDLHFMIRRESAIAGELSKYLRSDVVDGWYAEVPHPLGSASTPYDNPWTPRPENAESSQ